MNSVAVIGAGVVGRSLALELNAKGFAVTLVDQEVDLQQPNNCSFAAGGMISPIAELEKAEPQVHQMGLRAVELWQQHAKRHSLAVTIMQNGSMILAHPNDQALLREFEQKISRQLQGNTERFRAITPKDNPTESNFPGFLIADEGHLNPRELLQEQLRAIQESKINLLPGRAASIKPHKVSIDNVEKTFDWVCDCRGLAAKDRIDELRAVKGEAIIVKVAGVNIPCPIRLLHPRHPIYLIPRNDGTFYIGATSIESDLPGLTVQSALELLSTAATINSRFLQATIEEAV